MRIVMLAVLLAGLPLSPAFPQEPPSDVAAPTFLVDASALAFSPDGAHLATGGHDGSLKVWDVASRRELRQVAAKEEIESVAFSPDGKQIAVASDKNVTIVDAESGQQVRILKGAGKAAFSPSGGLLASGDRGASGTVKLWDLASGKETNLRGHLNPITSLSFSPDGRFLASGGNDNMARIWDVVAGKELHRFTGSEGGFGLFVNSVRFSPDGKAIAYSSMAWESVGAGTFKPAGERILIRDAATGAEIRSIEAHKSFASDLAFTPDGKLMLSAGDEVVKIWDLATGAEKRTMKTGHVSRLCVSPDGAWLAYAAKGGIRLVRLTDAP